MRMHPAILMALVWVGAIVAFFVLPFELTTRKLSVEGFLVLALFIVVFSVGTISLPLSKQSGVRADGVAPDFHTADRIFRALAIITVLVLLIDYVQGSVATLSDSYESRTDRAGAIITGEASGSSFFFRIGFLTYPASYAVIVREIVFRDRIDTINLGLYGILPIAMAALVMGGRGPILLAMAFVVASWSVRRMLHRARGIHRKKLSGRQVGQIFIGAIAALSAMNYFVLVFVTRAEGSGGIDHMLFVAAQLWGVDFRGPGAELLKSTIGEGNTYLVFVFIWYLIQGVVITNTLFTDYVGSPTFGVYGVDLVTAVARRIDPSWVSEHFLVLLNMNVYGFFPAAWGSLYVDFLWFGLVAAFLWGLICAIVYRKTRTSYDHRWLLIGPLVTIGIFFSLINTPIGFSNGLVTHFWFVFMVLVSKPVALMRRARVTAVRRAV